MGFQEQEMVGKFFQSLKENPTLIAACLVYGEKMTLVGFKLYNYGFRYPNFLEFIEIKFETNH